MSALSAIESPALGGSDATGEVSAAATSTDIRSRMPRLVVVTPTGRAPSRPYSPTTGSFTWKLTWEGMQTTMRNYSDVTPPWLQSHPLTTERIASLIVAATDLVVAWTCLVDAPLSSVGRGREPFSPIVAAINAI